MAESSSSQQSKQSKPQSSSSASSSSSSSAPSPSFSAADLLKIQSQIETYMRSYLSREEVMKMLEPHISLSLATTVWQKLEEQNPEFFKMYHTLCRVVQLVKESNTMIEQQIELMKQNGLPAYPIIVDGLFNFRAYGASPPMPPQYQQQVPAQQPAPLPAPSPTPVPLPAPVASRAVSNDDSDSDSDELQSTTGSTLLFHSEHHQFLQQQQKMIQQQLQQSSLRAAGLNGGMPLIPGTPMMHPSIPRQQQQQHQQPDGSDASGKKGTIHQPSMPIQQFMPPPGYFYHPGMHPGVPNSQQRGSGAV